MMYMYLCKNKYNQKRPYKKIQNQREPKDNNNEVKLHV